MMPLLLLLWLLLLLAEVESELLFPCCWGEARASEEGKDMAIWYTEKNVQDNDTEDSIWCLLVLEVEATRLLCGHLTECC